MFKKILLVYSEKLSENHKKVIEKVKKILIGKIFFCLNVRDLDEKYFREIDLAISVGGDGTFIRTSHFLEDIPILGINSEPKQSEGALTSLKENELEKIKDILNGKFKIIKRERAEVFLNDKKIKELALNEVYIGSEHQFHVSRYKIKFKNFEEEQRSSGVLITTGSGSMAWYKSAGGNPFSFSEKILKFLVREPYSGKIFSTKILQGEIKENEKIEFESRRHNEGIVAIDSNVVYPFNFGDKVEVFPSEKPLKVIILS